ncbi:MAG: glycoside hydrolase family protein [Stenomitos rutilans HA7619-LM2]|nr:glycoside hydrolase family protein [Stenomitos rutilans HA7619-LM2]
MALLDDLVRIGAPLLGSVIGGPATLAAAPISLILHALNLPNNSSPQDITKEIQANPDAALKLRELEVNYHQYLASVRLQMDQAEYADRASARSREVEITKATGKKDWYPSVLGTFVILAFTVLLSALIFHPPKLIGKDDANYASYQTQQSLINILIGALTAGFSTVLGYYFGSSAGSRNKDDTIASLSSDLPEPPSASPPPAIPPLLIPILPQPDQPNGTVSLNGSDLGVVQPASRTPTDPIADPSNVAPSVGLSPAVKNGSGRASINQLPGVSSIPSTITGTLKPRDPNLSPQAQTIIPPQAVKLIQEFEGCELSAYPDPKSGNEPWTIGWGTTIYPDGRKVRRGERITQAQADEYLNTDLKKNYWNIIKKAIPYWDEMHDDMRSALCSFAYNLGAHFYGDETDFHTITTCLKERRWHDVPNALMLYVNPGSNVTEGLRRRRRRECDFWQQGLRKLGVPSPALHVEAVKEILKYPQKPKPTSKEFKLDVPFNDQNDNSGSKGQGAGSRQCNLTSAAMLAKYLKPSLWGEYSDFANGMQDVLRKTGGDTTDSGAITRALRSIGIESYFSTTISLDELDNSLYNGIPMQVGTKYKIDGHFIIIIGRDPKGYVCHNPFGSRAGTSDEWITIGDGSGANEYLTINWMKTCFVDMGPDAGWARVVTGVDGIPTGLKSGM